jgi:hypothetical protein
MYPDDTLAVPSTHPLSKEYIWKQKKMIRYGAGTGERWGEMISRGKFKDGNDD